MAVRKIPGRAIKNKRTTYPGERRKAKPVGFERRDDDPGMTTYMSHGCA